MDTAFQSAVSKFSGDSIKMYLGKRHGDKELLSTRTQFFIRVHHLLVLGIVAWVGYLFAVKELL